MADNYFVVLHPLVATRKFLTFQNAVNWCKQQDLEANIQERRINTRGMTAKVVCEYTSKGNFTYQKM